MDAQFNRISGQDGSADCQPVVFEHCVAGQVREAGGRCASDCVAQCGEAGGKLLGASGTCECAGTPPLDVTCGQQCREAADVTVLVSYSLDGEPLTDLVSTSTNPDDGSTVAVLLSVGDVGISGDAVCESRSRVAVGAGGRLRDPLHRAQAAAEALVQAMPGAAVSGSCVLASLRLTRDSMEGVYGTVPVVQDAELQLAREVGTVTWQSVAAHEPLVEVHLGASTRGRQLLLQRRRFNRALGSQASEPSKRVLDTTDAGTVAGGASIKNPVVCLNLHEGLLFDLGAGSGVFPEYDKDSLLNTNPNFDFGQFRRLREVMQATGNVSAFTFTFDSPGVHVFVSSGDPSDRIIVRVMGVGQVCPNRGAYIMPTTEASLVVVGVRVDETILVAIDWPKVVAVTVVLTAAGLAVAILGWHVALGDWMHSLGDRMAFRADARAANLRAWHSKGETVTMYIPPGTIPLGSDASAAASPEKEAASITSSSPIPTPASLQSPLSMRSDETGSDSDTDSVESESKEAQPGIFDELLRAPRAHKVAGRMGIARALETFHVPRTLEVSRPGIEAWSKEDLLLREFAERARLHHEWLQGGLQAVASQTQALVYVADSQFASLRRAVGHMQEANFATAVLSSAGSSAPFRLALLRRFEWQVQRRSAVASRAASLLESLWDTCSVIVQATDPGGAAFTDEHILELVSIVREQAEVLAAPVRKWRAQQSGTVKGAPAGTAARERQQHRRLSQRFSTIKEAWASRRQLSSVDSMRGLLQGGAGALPEPEPAARGVHVQGAERTDLASSSTADDAQGWVVDEASGEAPEVKAELSIRSVLHEETTFPQLVQLVEECQQTGAALLDLLEVQGIGDPDGAFGAWDEPAFLAGLQEVTMQGGGDRASALISDLAHIVSEANGVKESISQLLEDFMDVDVLLRKSQQGVVGPLVAASKVEASKGANAAMLCQVEDVPAKARGSLVSAVESVRNACVRLMRNSADLKAHVVSRAAAAAQGTPGVLASIAATAKNLEVDGRGIGRSYQDFNAQLNQAKRLIVSIQDAWGVDLGWSGAEHDHDSSQHEEGEYGVHDTEYVEEGWDEWEQEIPESHFQVEADVTANAEEAEAEAKQAADALRSDEQAALDCDQEISAQAKLELIRSAQADADALNEILAEELGQQLQQLTSVVEGHRAAAAAADRAMLGTIADDAVERDMEAKIAASDEVAEQELLAALASIDAEGDDFRQELFTTAAFDGKGDDLSPVLLEHSSDLSTNVINSAEVQLERLHAEHTENMLRVQERHEAVRQRQREDLHRKLAARRKRREEALEVKLKQDAEEAYSLDDAEYYANEERVALQRSLANEERLAAAELHASQEEEALSHLQQLQESHQRMENVFNKLASDTEADVRAAKGEAEELIRARSAAAKQHLLGQRGHSARSTPTAEVALELARIDESEAEQLAAVEAVAQVRLAKFLAAAEGEAGACTSAARSFGYAIQVQERQLELSRSAIEALHGAVQDHEAESARQQEELARAQAAELEAAVTDMEAEALLAKHQLEAEELKAKLAAAERQKSLALEEVRTRQALALEEEVKRLLAEHEREQDTASAARLAVRKAQQASAKKELAARQARRRQAAARRMEAQLSLAQEEGGATDELEATLQQCLDASASEEEGALRALDDTCSVDQEAATRQYAAGVTAGVSERLRVGSTTALEKKEQAETAACMARNLSSSIVEQADSVRQAIESGDLQEATSKAYAAGAEVAHDRHQATLAALRAQHEKWKQEQEMISSIESSLLAEAARIQEVYAAQRQATVNAKGCARQKQAMALELKLQRRKQKKAALAAQQRNAKRKEFVARQEAELTRLLREQRSKVMQSAKNGSLSIVHAVEAAAAAAGQSHDQEADSEAAGIQAEYEARRLEVAQRHAAELQRLRDEAEEEERQVYQQALDAAERMKRERLAALEREGAAEAQWGASEAQLAEIKAAQVAEAQKVEAAVEEERKKQLDKLQAQIAARRLRKERRLAARHAHESSEVERGEVQALAASQAAAAKRRDLVALESAIQASQSTADKGAAIERVLRVRHAQETSNLLHAQFAQRSAELKHALHEILSLKAEEKAELMATLEEAEASDGEVTLALSELDAKFQQALAIKRKELSAQLDAQHEAQRAELQRRQMTELTDSFAQLNPADVLRRQQAKERERAAAEAEDLKRRLLLERQKKLEAAAKLRAQREAELEAAKTEAQQALAAQLEAQKAEQEQAMRLQMASRKARLQAEGESKMKEQLELSGEDEDTKRRVLEEHKRNMQRLETSISKERRRQAERLQAHLLKRKQKLLRKQQRALAQASQAVASQSIQQLDTALSSAHTMRRGRRKAGGDKVAPATGAPTTTGSELSPAKPPRPSKSQGRRGPPKLATVASTGVLEQRLGNIERSLANLLSATAHIPSAAPVLCSADAFELRIRVGKFVEVAKELPVEAQGMLSFGQRLMSTLTEEKHQVHLKPAKQLPPAVSEGNAFSRSYLFDQPAGILYVHIERLSRGARLPIVLAHAAAHMKVDPSTMGPDTNSVFQGCFGEFLAQVSELLLEFGGGVTLADSAQPPPDSVAFAATGSTLDKPEATLAMRLPSLDPHPGLVGGGGAHAEAVPGGRAPSVRSDTRADRLLAMLGQSSTRKMDTGAVAARAREYSSRAKSLLQ